MSSYELCKLNKKLTVIMQLKTSNHFFNINFSYNFFCRNMKISKDLPAKYYQNKKGFKKTKKEKKKKTVTGIKIVLKKTKTKSGSMFANIIKFVKNC